MCRAGAWAGAASQAHVQRRDLPTEFPGVRGHGDKAVLADHCAAMVGLKGFEASDPHERSGGMLKRAELARAFVVKPDILYLDALMNPLMRYELLRILGEGRHTVLLITHDVEEALCMADRIMVLSPRPTTIRARFAVDMPHPRRLSSRRPRRCVRPF